MKTIEEIYAMDALKFDDWQCSMNRNETLEYQKLIVNLAVADKGFYSNVEEYYNGEWRKAMVNNLDFKWCYYRIIPEPKELTYTERQAKWIADNNIKVGDSVAYRCDGNTYNIRIIYDSLMLIGNHNRNIMVEYPDLTLLPQNKEPTYIPFKFDDWQLFHLKPYRKKDHTIRWETVLYFGEGGLYNPYNLVTYDELLDKFEMLHSDGSITPFGKKVKQ